jgi:hypothetical protein
MNPEIKQEELIKAEVSFYLTDGCCHVNSITTTKSGIINLENSLLENFNKQDGALLIKGSPENADDFYLIPPRSIIAITFKVKPKNNIADILI